MAFPLKFFSRSSNFEWSILACVNKALYSYFEINFPLWSHKIGSPFSKSGLKSSLNFLTSFFMCFVLLKTFLRILCFSTNFISQMIIVNLSLTPIVANGEFRFLTHEIYCILGFIDMILLQIFFHNFTFNLRQFPNKSCHQLKKNSPRIW